MPPFYGRSRFGGNEKETPDLCLRMFRYVSDAYSDSSQKPTQSPFPEKSPVVMTFFVAHTAGIKLFRILTGSPYGIPKQYSVDCGKAVRRGNNPQPIQKMRHLRSIEMPQPFFRNKNHTGPYLQTHVFYII